MITSNLFRSGVRTVQHVDNPSSLLDGQRAGIMVPSAFAVNGRSYGWPTSLPPCIARWTPESMESNGSYFSWNDVSGNGFHARGTGSYPSFGTGLNGRRSMVGSSSDLRLNVTPKHIINGLTEFALFAVVKTPASAQGLQSFIGGSSFGGTTTNMFNVELSAGAYPCQFQMRTEHGDDAAVTGTSTLTAASSIAASTWYAVLFNWDGTNIQGYLNGASSGSSSAPVGRNRLYHASAFKLMGTNYPSDFWWRGEMLEVAIMGKGLDSGQRSDLFAYHLAAYGL